MKNENFGIRLKHYRDLKGISQGQLAKKINTGQGYISEIESDLKSPTLRMLYKIAHALGICHKLLLPCIMEECIEKFECECELNINDCSNI